ncbi:hypothetical protein [Allosediminivita pacifica]|uniref:Uncharacterized protein n=1 Tax=Allosediminivita pacifica TaxID=1267769 RepID=A0A2T6AJ40_9RHOB|nr:hypothetical protein [Allosediminivita pacifica]PTX43830.1 hypothetical protein C8N44_12442 [Allosediminivita pacifica]GGB22126.1 hypothetical protein GCM10011324_35190 [Allosediminivita pacifica]
MSLIRPEAAKVLNRWREALIGAAVLCLGTYWTFLTGPGLLRWAGVAVAMGGVALAVAGIQRARFRGEGQGPGVVHVVEGQITYFGPLTGGVAYIESMRALSLDPRAEPPHWLLEQEGQPTLAIPVNAEGAEQLFDAFAHLPGIRTEKMLRELRGGATEPVLIWRAEPARTRAKRLH